jgi:threonine dehydratase
MAAALDAGRRVRLDRVGLFADGVAVRQAGAENFRIARQVVDACLRVSIDELCAATRDVFAENRSLPEPAGALGVAGVKRWVAEQGVQGKTFVAIVSGANLNFDRLRHIAERAELGDGLETLLAVTIAEKPGSFRHFVKFADAEEREATIAGLRADGLSVVDMSGDEMAKVHVRYLVGGRAPGLSNEQVFRFEFPERPGACLDFLNAIGTRWNISLFHYRNHGAAYGRVLCGLQVPSAERSECLKTLDGLGYQYWEETDNPAYALFLSADTVA